MLVRTIAELVDRLGGNKAVAEMVGVGVSAVSNWRTWNRLPPRLHLRLYRECERLEIEVDPAIFSESNPPSALAHAGAKPRRVG